MLAFLFIRYRAFLISLTMSGVVNLRPICCCVALADFQYALRDEILRHTQRDEESIADYLICTKAFFDRLN